MKDNFFKRFSSSVIVEDFSHRVQWIIFLRWFAGLGVVTLSLAGKSFLGIEAIIIPLSLGLAILIYNLIFYLITKAVSEGSGGHCPNLTRRFFLLNCQIFLDLVVLAALVYYTGGVSNPFLFFFLFHMVISSILLSRLNAYFWAVFTIIMEMSLFYLEVAGIIPPKRFFTFFPEPGPDFTSWALLIFVVFSLTLVVTVYFATSIMRPIRKWQLDTSDLQNDLRKQRDQLEQKNQELREMDRSKTDFLYRVEHELKAPIEAISSLLSVVIHGYASVEEKKKKEFLKRTMKRVMNMKDLVRDLLTLSRINEKGFSLDVEKIDLKSSISKTIADLKLYSDKKEINIETDFGRSVPMVNGDRHSLHEICYNLIHNSIKYSFKGVVKVSLKKSNGKVQFSVADNGIGISEEDQESIFIDFFRTASAKAFEEGTGLGLSLVKRLVEKHNGTIKVESRLNKGTAFIVTFPAAGIKK